jgi:hypothetical protein
MNRDEFPPVPQLTPEQLKRRDRRSLALALVLGALVVFFFVVTLVKTGPAIFNRPL